VPLERRIVANDRLALDLLSPGTEWIPVPRRWAVRLCSFWRRQNWERDRWNWSVIERFPLPLHVGRQRRKLCVWSHRIFLWQFAGRGNVRLLSSRRHSWTRNDGTGRIDAATVSLCHRVGVVHPVIVFDACRMIWQMIRFLDVQGGCHQRVVIGPNAACADSVTVDATARTQGRGEAENR